ncbi:MAG: acetolactate synthase small subunit [Candidatus Saganbacteria bacterium]|nr:acetolactate synthase small subunit [Candidatus Saganbacteria bacterium]
MKKHTIAVIVNNRAGVLSRVSGLFSRRGYNIHSLAVGTTEDEDLSRMTIVVEGDDEVLEQITKQLYKIIEVVRVYELSNINAVDRELVMIKVAASDITRPEIQQIVDIFRAKVVDLGETALIIEATGDSKKIDALEELLKKFGIREMVRTGKISLARSEETK